MTTASNTILGALSPRTSQLMRGAVPVAVAVAVLAVSSKVQVPMWPVPMTLQTLAVLLVAMVMGRTLALASIGAWLVAGALGLPVFAGAGGLAYLMGPTAGYLAGFALVALIVGGLADRGLTRTLPGALALALVGVALIYLAGASWLAYFVGVQTALTVGVLPFVAGDLVKAVLAALLLPLGWRLLARL